MRPNFFHICNPRIPPNLDFFQAKQVCRGNARQVKEAQMSFPSGHASAAFAGFGFLALYINAKYKVFGRGRRSGFPHDAVATTPAAANASTEASVPETNANNASSTVREKQTITGAKAGRIQHWKLVLFALPWLIATLLALTKIRDG